MFSYTTIYCGSEAAKPNPQSVVFFIDPSGLTGQPRSAETVYTNITEPLYSISR